MEFQVQNSKNNDFCTRLKIAVVGRGNVSSHLTQALIDAGHDVFPCGGRGDMKPVPEGTEVVIICIKDDAIAGVSEHISRTNPDSLIVHTAGSIPMDIIPSARRGVLYPMQTFSKNRELTFSEIPLFVEASNEDDTQLLLSLAKSLGCRVMVMDSERRKTLHLAAVLCCNFVNHLYDLTAGVLAEKDIPFDIMLPLIDETARKVHDISPHEAQTGPARRWDESVINAHLSMINDERTRTIYRLLSESIHFLT